MVSANPCTGREAGGFCNKERLGEVWWAVSMGTGREEERVFLVLSLPELEAILKIGDATGSPLPLSIAERSRVSEGGRAFRERAILSSASGTNLDSPDDF